MQFTHEDIQFILQVLGGANQQAVLTDLLADENTRDLILDDEKLYQAVLDQVGCVRISTRLYFYVLTRRLLLDAGIDDRNVADYLAELLAEYSNVEQMTLRLPGQKKSLDYIFEMMAALQTADDRTAFLIRAHIGNHSLFFAGVFFERLRRRCERHGAPGLRYYEEMGRMNYRVASDHRLAQKYELAPIYSTLADQFETARIALNEMKDRLLSLDDRLPGMASWLAEDESRER